VLIKPSLLVMGVVLVLLFAPRYDDREGTSPYVLAAVFVVALYLSVLVHELAHVAVARAYRMRVASVTLHLLGGETLIEGESSTPGQELATSISGPLASLGIAIAAFAVSDGMDPGTASDIIWSIASVNLIVAIFNMLPGLPLDGGRVFRAIIWKVTGREETGVRIAAWIGRFTAVGVLVVAVLTFSDVRDTTINLGISAFVSFFLWEGVRRPPQRRAQRPHQPLGRARHRLPRRHPAAGDATPVRRPAWTRSSPSHGGAPVRGLRPHGA
jgi:Zn-dependent protease